MTSYLRQTNIVATPLEIQKLHYLNHLHDSHRITPVNNDMVLLHIPNFSLLKKLHALSPTAHFRSIVTKHFTLSGGYNFRLRIFTNGSGDSKGKFMSAYVQMRRNNYRKDINYPFRGVITFVVIDQSSHGDHVKKSIRASGNNLSFQQPQSVYNTENGVEALISHEQLYNDNIHETAYLQKDMLILGVAIRYNEKVQ